jgi:hypothetical protein
MICPKCKSEFFEGITTCPDCQIQLVYQITENIPEHFNDSKNCNYVFVYTPISSQEVALIRMIMERESIPYFIKNEPLHKSAIFSIRGPGEIQLYVAEEFAEDTIKLLREELGHE